MKEIEFSDNLPDDLPSSSFFIRTSIQRTLSNVRIFISNEVISPQMSHGVYYV